MSSPDLTLTATQVALGFLLALAVGGAVGLERERHAFAEQKQSFGGARTFPLVALLGALSALLARSGGVSILIAGFAALAVLLGLGYLGARRESGDLQLGLTTELAALLVFAVGALPFVALPELAFPARLLLAGALGTVVMALLALHRPLHEFAQRVSYEDLLATVRFALVAVVALPLLPDQDFGPFDVLNPFRIGVVIVLIAGISFVGYVAVRLFGARKGLGLMAIAGGLVSSTAVTLAFAAKGREHSELTRACALAIGLASTIMFLRVVAEVAAIRPELVAGVALPMGAMLVVGVAGCLVLWRRIGAVQDGDETGRLHNPFRLRTALRLGLAYTVIRLVAAAAWEYLGSGGLLVSAFLSGLADVDAITISVARMHETGLDTDIAVSAVTIAAATNTLVKVGLAIALGGRRVGLAVAAVLVPAAAAGMLVGFL